MSNVIENDEFINPTTPQPGIIMDDKTEYAVSDDEDDDDDIDGNIPLVTNTNEEENGENINDDDLNNGVNNNGSLALGVKKNEGNHKSTTPQGPKEMTKEEILNQPKILNRK